MKLTVILYIPPVTLSNFHPVTTMDPRAKTDAIVVNLMLPPIMDIDHVPLADKDYKIFEKQCQFVLFELHFWFCDTYLDQSDEIGL